MKMLKSLCMYDAKQRAILAPACTLVTIDMSPDDLLKIGWCNGDSGINNHGKKNLELCRQFKLIIANGRAGVDKVGDFICANTSTSDYCVASLKLFHVFNNFAVGVFGPFMSDKHNPIVSRLNIGSRYDKRKK